MRGRQKPEIHESADFLVAGWRHSTLLSPVESLPRPDVYIAREKGRWKKRRSLCFGNWPNPAMFSICSKAPLVQHPPLRNGPKTGRRSPKRGRRTVSQSLLDIFLREKFIEERQEFDKRDWYRRCNFWVKIEMRAIEQVVRENESGEKNRELDAMNNWVELVNISKRWKCMNLLSN